MGRFSFPPKLEKRTVPFSTLFQLSRKEFILKMKEKFKNFIRNEKTIIILFIILELFLMVFVNNNIEDDSFFIELGKNNSNTFEIVKNRYNTWSSRVFIEFVLIEVLKSKVLWAIIQSLMMGLLAYSISKLFIKAELKSKLNPIICALILTYPINMLTLIGWGASTVNYIWPLATCLYALIPIKKYYNNEKIKWFEYPIYICALLFACNID